MTESEQIVYISCVEEVRYSFVSHLSEALRRKGIHDVFVDSDDLLSNESQSKVERARVSLMVLPGNHKVNLDKLAEVLECQKNKDQVAIPVLYGVRSLDSEWLIALDSKGFSSVHYSRNECPDSELVEEITRDVYDKLFYMERIGIYSKLQEIENMVWKQPFGVRCVGIWGMPGIGKTTLAKAVFDQMSGDFDAYCFIEDYDKVIHEKGLYRLLEEHLLKEKPGACSTITKLSLLSNKLNNKRVLVVLDDVRNPLMAEPLLRGFDWFGPESLIIITSRDKQVFRLCRVSQIYEVQGLNEKEALQLFSLSASIKNDREPNLHKLSMKVIECANGNPLALSIYGREFKGKKNLAEMETTFLNLKGHPPIKIFDAFKSSYDSLNDRERNIFLDIACFFQGEDVDYVMQLLGGCGFLPHVGINVLVEKCLVTISENRVWMHNLIQDVGQEIINTETEQIERRSRLWEPESIKCLLEDNEHAQGTEEIQGIFLDTSNLSFNMKPAAFDNMLNLRFLKIYCSDPKIHPVINFSNGSLRYLSNELRLLHWENYPLQFLPENFDPMHLIEIDMQYSQLQTLWGKPKNLKMLRTIRLCHSQKLVDVGDLSKAQDLEVIDLQGCTGLQSFPATDKLLHLRVVNLSGCTEIKEFPEVRPNIEALHLQGTGIRKIIIFEPNGGELVSLSELKGLSNELKLELLARREKSRSSSQELAKLICLELKDCTRLKSLPNMVNLELLKVLDLSGCWELETIQGFPPNLKELSIAGTAVREVPQLPQSLELFNAHGCVSLKSIHLDSEKLPMHYTFSNCFDLSPQVNFLVEVLANAEHIPRERRQELNKSLAFSFCAPSHANQYSTLDLQPGSSVVTQLNPSWRNTLVGFAMLVEVAFSEDYCDATGFGISCVCRWNNKVGRSPRIERNLHCWALGKSVQKDHMFVFCDVNIRPSNDEGNDIWADLVVFEFFPVDKQTKPLSDSCTVRRCGVRVVTDANCNKSIENILPVWSLEPMEVSGNGSEEALRFSYDGLQEIDKALFLYIVGLFNDEDVDLVAPHIANIIDMDVSNGLKVLADRSLIRVSSNGEIVMPSFLRQMGKEILHTESKKIERLGDNSMAYTMKTEYTRKERSDSQRVKEIEIPVYEKLFHMGGIGIYPKLLEIEKLVYKQPLDIRCVGIWGMPGIGKTTLAKAFFDQMSGEFDAYCFIEDYTKAIQEKGIYRLLEEHFFIEKAVAGGTDTTLSLLRDKLNNKRVLVVLDDVRDPLAAESFLGWFDWFGPKSLIIITSRDKQVFRLCRVNQIYEVHGLNDKEALLLFLLCASIDKEAERNLHEVSMKVIKYANGHPLALNLYGRELKGKKIPPEMETAFLKLKERPPNKLVDAIKSSYETLNDRCRNIFLDIACFFQRESIDYVIQLLEGCGFFPHVGIDILVEKCLVTVSENRVCMHNLIQDVGRQIGRRSRLWEPWSIKYLLEDDEHNADVQGTEEIEGMFLDTSDLSFDIKPVAFDSMLNLRLLKIYCSNPEIHPVINLSSGLRYLPNELRLLHWENYPLQFLPKIFDPIHLVEINMPYSQLCRLWDGTKNLKMLRTIRLCHSQQLVDIDDLLQAPNLEVIDLQGCTRLQSFPATGQLLHLRVVNLSGCTEIKSFPEIPPNIETLRLQGTGITELPLSIVKPNYEELLNLLAEIPGLSGVSNLEQSDLKPLTSLMKMGTSNKNFGKLINLELKDCSRLRSLPDMDNLELIKVLDLSGCLELETIQAFPRNLKELYLAGTAVRQVPQLPQSLEIFNAHGCDSLKSIRLDFEKLPVHYTFSNCFDLSPQVVSDFLVKALAKAQHIKHHELNEALAFSLCVPSHANLYSTIDLQPGSSVMTQLNRFWRYALVGFAMLVEVAFSEDYCDATGFGIRCVCRWKNKEGHSRSIERNLHCWAPGKAVSKVQKDHMFVLCDVNMHPSIDMLADLVVFEFFPVDKQTKPSCTVRGCGVRVITDANCNTSIENILPVWSLDPMEVSGNEDEEALRISYDGLQEIDKALFHYIVGLFNDEDVGLVAPHIANIFGMDVSNGLKVLADRSLIRVSSNGEIVMPSLLRQMGKEILHTESKKFERLGDDSMANTMKTEYTRKSKAKEVVCIMDAGSQSGEEVVESSEKSITGSPNPRYMLPYSSRKTERTINAKKVEITHSENPENPTRDTSHVPTKRLIMADTLWSLDDDGITPPQ